MKAESHWGNSPSFGLLRRDSGTVWPRPDFAQIEEAYHIEVH